MFALNIAASIVAYNNDPVVLNEAISSFLDTTLSVAIVVIDNSENDSLQKYLIKDKRIHYKFNGYNAGFSKGHNQGFMHFKGQAEFFLVLNPDVYFDGSLLTTLYIYLKTHPKTGLVAPKVLYPTGQNQVSRRLIPTALDLIIRRLPLGKHLFSKRCSFNEYLDVDDHEIQEVPFLLGCFMLFRVSALEKTGLFDERYFMYLEDLDICRRLARNYDVVYYGQASIYHLYQRASSKNLKMLLLHTASMVKYFNKWGWLQDAEREEINRRAIARRQVNAEETNSVLSSEYATT